MGTMRIALAQINTTVGDLDGNARKIISYIERAKDVQADLVLFPELAVTGYPPEDLLLKPSFLSASQASVERIAASCTSLTAVVGYVDVDEDVHNAAAVICDGRIAGTYQKQYLPNYGVFDEDRYFRAGGDNPLFVLNGIVIGVSICEDIWYPDGPPQDQANSGAQLLVNISASPYRAGKLGAREHMLSTRAADNVAYVAFCNLVGGQDELVFDGGSVVYDTRGDLVARGPQFQEELVVVDINPENVFRQRLHDPRWRKRQVISTVRVELSTTGLAVPRPALVHRSISPSLGQVEEVYQALVTGTRDYVRKNGFQEVAIGLSGGVDSAMVACIAVDALGAENVTGVAMPSRYSAGYSETDAAKLARNLGTHFLTIPIERVFQAYLDTLAEIFAGIEPNVAEENLQARARGNILMALSNKFGWIVLTTGNKSEMSVGYATLYGDMAGGFAVIKDVPKVWVYELARWRNSISARAVIPERIIKRPPSAELRPDQKDTDSLPPYEVLDQILQAYVEEDQALADIVRQGFDQGLVEHVIGMVDRTEYKRRQAPPGIRITRRAFGKGRRLPITNKFRDKHSPDDSETYRSSQEDAEAGE